MTHPYTYIVLGGTFDLLHIGHKNMLNKAFEIGKFVTIGLTTDQFNKSRGKPSWQNQSLRLKNLKQYLQVKGFVKRCQIVFINDIFGTTLKDPTLEALVVTPTTKNVAHLINQNRVKRGFGKLDIITVPFTKDEAGQIISATRIRNGEINSSGQSYKNILLKIAGKKLDDDIRIKLKKPLGKIVTIKSIYQPPTTNHQPIISVGDVTTLNLLQEGIKPTLSIVDAKVGRKEARFFPFDYAQGQNDRGVRRVKNPPGQISKALILSIEKALKKPPTTNNQPPTIFVEGEEDLATIPVILLAPLGTTVLYGQPGKGLVSVKVDLKIKDYLLKVLNPN